MPAPDVLVGAAFGIPNPGDFVVGVSLVGGADLVASGFTTVTDAAELVTIQRGRFSQVTDVIDAGDMNVQFLNLTRDFDPSFVSSPYYPNVRPGVPMRVQVRATDGPVYVTDEFGNFIVDEFGNRILAEPLYPYPYRSLMTGGADGIEFEYDVSGRSAVIFRCTDALGQFGAGEFDAWTSAATSAGGKLSDVIQRPEVGWPSWKVEFDAGLEVLQSDSVSWGSNVLNYMQLIARSELGYLFASADNVLKFRDRNVAAGAVTEVSFGDFFVPYEGVSAKYAEFLFSRVGVDREGGINQTAEVADLAAWKAQNGAPRTLSLTGLLLDSDAQSLALAEFLLTQYSTPRFQIAEIRVQLAALPAIDQDAVLALDITSLVSVEFTPNNIGPAITQTLMVQGIAHELTPESHIVRLSLIAVPLGLFMVGSSLVGGPDVVAF